MNKKKHQRHTNSQLSRWRMQALETRLHARCCAALRSGDVGITCWSTTCCLHAQNIANADCGSSTRHTAYSCGTDIARRRKVVWPVAARNFLRSHQLGQVWIDRYLSKPRLTDMVESFCSSFHADEKLRHAVLILTISNLEWYSLLRWCSRSGRTEKQMKKKRKGKKSVWKYKNASITVHSPTMNPDNCRP